MAEGKGGVREAGYRERAVLELLGRSTLGRGVVREDWKGVEARVVLELLDVVELGESSLRREGMGLMGDQIFERWGRSRHFWRC